MRELLNLHVDKFINKLLNVSLDVVVREPGALKNGFEDGFIFLKQQLSFIYRSSLTCNENQRKFGKSYRK